MRGNSGVQFGCFKTVVVDAVELRADKAGGETANQADGGRMMGRLSQADANSRSKIPFGLGA